MNAIMTDKKQQTRERVREIQTLMQSQNIDGLIVDNSDPHNSEYVAEHWQSRSWLSGFTGSNGILGMTATKVGLWTDSRYYLIADAALADTGITVFRMGEEDVPSIEKWMCDQLDAGQTVSFDGRVTSQDAGERWQSAFDDSEIIVRTDLDPISIVCPERPPIPTGQVFSVPVEIVGESRTSKIARVREAMVVARADAYLLGRTDETAWLFNLRGTDLKNSVSIIAYTLVTAESITLFIDPVKVPNEIADSLDADNVKIRPYDEIAEALRDLAEGTRLLTPKTHLSQYLAQRIGHCRRISGRSIVTDLKAIKNETELSELRACLVRDGAAKVRFMHWLYQQLETGTLVTELSASRRLRDFRAEIPGFQHVSFSTIMGYNGDAALNHYFVTEETDVPIEAEGMLLIDSGGTYLDGTTDITRVLPLGDNTQVQRVDYTAVLKGLIALSTATFPAGTTCAQLDGICRAPMWALGRNFSHGTGHGIGFGLEVHEGPQNISLRSSEVMKPGMTTTIEPGTYRPDRYGIRIENIVNCIEHETNELGTFYRFETMTYCPINVDLVAVDLMTDGELAWLNAYNAKSFELLAPLVDDAERAWLRHACRPL